MSISIPVTPRVRRAFADTLYNLRVNNKQTQLGVATLLGVSKATYIKWEYGHSFPTLGNLYALCQLWQIPLSSLFLSAERRIHHAPLSRARRGRKQPPCSSVPDIGEK